MVSLNRLVWYGPGELGGTFRVMSRKSLPDQKTCCFQKISRSVDNLVGMLRSWSHSFN